MLLPFRAFFCLSVSLLTDLSPLQLLSFMHQGHSLIEAAMKQEKEKFGTECDINFFDTNECPNIFV